VEHAMQNTSVTNRRPTARCEQRCVGWPKS
jgi:hypothetical protein